MSTDGQKADFLASFDAYSDAIFRFCLVKVSNRELAEDMTQEVFMRYWQSLSKGQEMTNTRAFLYTVANNMAKDWYKKKKSVSLENELDTGWEPSDKSMDTEKTAEYREIIDKLDDLEEKDREVMILRYVDGLEPKEIAVILDETANNISVRINRATARLKAKLNL